MSHVKSIPSLKKKVNFRDVAVTVSENKFQLEKVRFMFSDGIRFNVQCSANRTHVHLTCMPTVPHVYRTYV